MVQEEGKGINHLTIGTTHLSPQKTKGSNVWGKEPEIHASITLPHSPAHPNIYVRAHVHMNKIRQVNFFPLRSYCVINLYCNIFVLKEENL